MFLGIVILWSIFIIIIIILFISKPFTLFLFYDNYYNYINLLLLFTPQELFTSAIADSFSLESEWQQVSPSHQDSS